MSKAGFLPRIIGVAIASLIVGFAFLRWTKQEPDLLKAFEPRTQSDKKILLAFQQSGPMSKKIFASTKGMSLEDKKLFDRDASELGLASVTSTESGKTTDSAFLSDIGASLMMAHGIDTIKSGKAAAKEWYLSLSLPGASPTLLENDPFGFLRFLRDNGQFSMASAVMSKEEVEIFSVPTVFNFEDAAKRWQFFLSWKSKAKLIGEDFFRFSNEAIIRRDILVVSLLGCIFNIALYVLFVRDIKFIGIFAAGSCCSWAFMIIGMKLFFKEVFPIVFAFASTFLSFNSEYQVHLCGLDGVRKRVVRKALISAVGTTVIGLTVLLFSSAQLFVQMGIAALFAMMGFFVGTMPFTNELKRIYLPRMTSSRATFERPWNRVPLWALVVLVVGFMSWYKGAPLIHTDIAMFRHAGKDLEENLAYFESLRGESTSYVAIEKGMLSQVLGEQKTEDFLKLHSNVLQPQEVNKYKEEVRLTALTELKTLGLELDPAVFPSLQQPAGGGVDAERLEKTVCDVFGVTCLPGESDWFGAMVNASTLEKFKSMGAKYIKIDPKLYYNDTLVEYSWQTMRLFSYGLIIMVFYLLVIQRSLSKVFIILLPLLLTCLGGAWLFSVFGIPVTIAHIIGLILVIGFSLDYTAIAVSTEYAEEDRSKILLTGLSTLASFIGLCFAGHSFLFQMGFVVCIGVSISLIFTLVISKKTVARSRGSSPIRFR